MDALDQKLTQYLQEFGLAETDALLYANRLAYLTAQYAALAAMTTPRESEQSHFFAAVSAKEVVRERMQHAVLDINIKANEGKGSPAIKGVDFEYYPDCSAVAAVLVTGQEIRIDGSWGMAAFEGAALVDSLTRVDNLKKRLADHGQDPKYLDQMMGKMQAEKITSLDDAEIERALENVVLSGFCIEYVKVARECGLEIADLYPEAALDQEIERTFHRVSGLARQGAKWEGGELVLYSSPACESYVAQMPNGHIAITDGYNTDYVTIRGKGEWSRDSDQLEISQDIRDFLTSAGSTEEAVERGLQEQRRRDDDTPSPM